MNNMQHRRKLPLGETLFAAAMTGLLVAGNNVIDSYVDARFTSNPAVSIPAHTLREGQKYTITKEEPREADVSGYRD